MESLGMLMKPFSLREPVTFSLSDLCLSQGMGMFNSSESLPRDCIFFGAAFTCTESSVIFPDSRWTKKATYRLKYWRPPPSFSYSVRVSFPITSFKARSPAWVSKGSLLFACCGSKPPTRALSGRPGLKSVTLPRADSRSQVLEEIPHSVRPDVSLQD